MNHNNRRIQILPPGEARKIAAGEVIDRPAALVREFMDNALDSGASSITVSIAAGGAGKTEVQDDGIGMTKEDLELCTENHATSKIAALEDLASCETLGFRGEALAAVAAVARLEIHSSADGQEGWILSQGPGDQKPTLKPANRIRGTTVRSLGLFDAIPARKRFLKREGTEGSLCRQAFIEKALAFPERNFRFFQDGALKLFLPAAASYKERYIQALLPASDGAFMHEIAHIGQGFRAILVFGGPELYRNDRRYQYIFANKRKIQDYALQQALEYGLQSWFPGGTHPIGAAFIEIDPALADFNVHPAKREARFSDPAAIHQGISSTLRDVTRAYAVQQVHAPETQLPLRWTGDASPRPAAGEAAHLALAALLENPPEFIPPPRQYSPESAAGGEALGTTLGTTLGETLGEPSPLYNQGKPRLAGRLFALFILIEWQDRLYIIDQHAAHERIIYNRFISSPIARQELLAPIIFETERPADDAFLSLHRESLAALGVIIHQEGQGWRIDALPAGWGLSDGETLRELLSLKEASDSMAERWAATYSCHQAVKDGDYLSDAQAEALALEALALPEKRCPHGRPILIEISRSALFKAVKRE